MFVVNKNVDVVIHKTPSDDMYAVAIGVFLKKINKTASIGIFLEEETPAVTAMRNVIVTGLSKRSSSSRHFGTSES